MYLANVFTEATRITWHNIEWAMDRLMFSNSKIRNCHNIPMQIALQESKFIFEPLPFVRSGLRQDFDCNLSSSFVNPSKYTPSPTLADYLYGLVLVGLNAVMFPFVFDGVESLDMDARRSVCEAF